MSHRFLEGKVVHVRHAPKKHSFTYRYFMIDIDTEKISQLTRKFFSLERINLMSFFHKDHFGNSKDLEKNIENLAKQMGFEPHGKYRFLTLPRIFGFVFNPISIALCLEDNTPRFMLVEVHNYNGGRIVYPVSLQLGKKGKYTGTSNKDMYVSPFFERIGDYRFGVEYTDDYCNFTIELYEDDIHMLSTNMHLKSKEFSDNMVWTLLAKHSFLTMWVVTRTLWQTLKLWRKGLQWHSPAPIDQTRRY